MPFSSRGAPATVAKAAIGDAKHRESGSGVLDVSLPAAHHMKIQGIQLHLDGSSVTNERMIVAIDSNDGEAFDTVIMSESMTGISDVAITDQFLVARDDVLRVTFSNPAAANWGLTILYVDG